MACCTIGLSFCHGPGAGFEESTDYWGYRTRRSLSGPVVAFEGIRGTRYKAAYVVVQHPSHRPYLRRSSRAGTAFHASLWRPDRLEQSDSDCAESEARRNLQSWRAEPREGVVRR